MYPPQNQGEARRFSAASGKIDFLSFCLWSSRKSGFFVELQCAGGGLQDCVEAEHKTWVGRWAGGTQEAAPEPW